MLHVVQITSAHPRFDVRIFRKICLSLARSSDYRVSLVVADGLGDETVDGVQIVDAGQHSGGRLSRMTRTVNRVVSKALELGGDVYHMHDPELMPAARRLRRRDGVVVFDAHEDLPLQLQSKPYLNAVTRRILSAGASTYECWACASMDGIIAATPSIRDKFLKINANTVDVCNYPLLSEFSSTGAWAEKRREVCYVGGITLIRGIVEITKALAMTDADVRLNLCGKFGQADIERTVRALPGWRQVNDHGFVDRAAISQVLGRSMAGLVTLHPQVNFFDALPVKMFEYMGAGIPVIASDFPLWRKIINDNACGVLVDPMDPVAIAKAIDYLAAHPAEAQRMGENGRKAVRDKYNWGVEEHKLLRFYKDLGRHARKALIATEKGGPANV